MRIMGKWLVLQRDSYLKKRKLGIVSYLNVQPLIYGLGTYNLVEGTPSKLAYLYRRGEIDCALLPIYEVLARENIFIVDGISISSREEAGSVLCFLNKDVEHVRNIALDSGSLSSIHLLKLIMRLYFGIDCLYELLDSDLLIRRREDFDAYLLIGDNAIYHRGSGVNFFDLGSVWYRWTGYPFVFAVWAVYGRDEQLKCDLIRSKDEGLRNLDNIISRLDFRDKSFLLDYYKRYLYFGLSDKSKEAIKLYQKFLYQEGFYTDLREPLYY